MPLHCRINPSLPFSVLPDSVQCAQIIQALHQSAFVQRFEQSQMTDGVSIDARIAAASDPTWNIGYLQWKVLFFIPVLKFLVELRFHLERPEQERAASEVTISGNSLVFPSWLISYSTEVAEIVVFPCLKLHDQIFDTFASEYFIAFVDGFGVTEFVNGDVLLVVPPERAADVELAVASDRCDLRSCCKYPRQESMVIKLVELSFLFGGNA